MKAVVLAVAAASLVAAPPALAARVAASPGLLELPRYEHALIQLAEGSLAHDGGVLIAPRVGVWRLPTANALRVLPRLLEADRVEAVEPDRPLEPLAAAADPLSAGEWWRPVVRADRVTPPGPGKPLTIIDSGLDVGHPEFVARPNTAVLNPQRFDDSELEEHGTAVTSIAAAPENGVGIVGVYPQANLRVWDAGQPTLGRVISGIDASISAGAGVVNISLGFHERSTLLERAVLSAVRAGAVVVAAVGNERRRGSPRSYPGSLSHVLTVAATDRADAAAAFSSASEFVDLAAPGVALLAAVPPDGYGTGSGTSFAAPIVSAATAWVWTARPQLDATQVFDLMRRTARDVGPRGFDRDTGFGVLDLARALTERAPPRDHQEPNDDVEYVVARGVFASATASLTTPSRGRSSLRARLDAREDPRDVYRVWVPARRVVRVTVMPETDVDVRFWNARTPSVHVLGLERRRHLIAVSARRGRAVERLTVRNRGRRGYYGYLDVHPRRVGASPRAEYRLTISTARR